MKRTTKKLSGVGLEHFLRRFFARYNDIDDALADKLAKDGSRAFASARVRQMAWRNWRGRPGPKIEASSVGGAVETGQIAAAGSIAPAAPPAPSEASVASVAPAATPPADQPGTAATQPAAPETAADTAPFDPYSIGLVPTYQREGADGLMVKLAGISAPENLRKMARAQQVALPAELRGPDADIAAIRAAIIEAVGKRIANRRAAAG